MASTDVEVVTATNETVSNMGVESVAAVNKTASMDLEVGTAEESTIGLNKTAGVVMDTGVVGVDTGRASADAGAEACTGAAEIEKSETGARILCSPLLMLMPDPQRE
jgi:hypothetical protein